MLRDRRNTLCLHHLVQLRLLMVLRLKGFEFGVAGSFDEIGDWQDLEWVLSDGHVILTHIDENALLVR